MLIELKDNKVLGIENSKMVKMEDLKVIMKQTCLEFFDTIQVNNLESLQAEQALQISG